MGAPHELSDIELGKLIIANDQDAFVELYNRYWAVLYIHAKRMTRVEEDAEDVVQELFSHLWNKRHELNFSTSLKGYLFNAVRNKVFNLIERKRVTADYVNSLKEFASEGKLITDELYREKELSMLIEAGIQSLPAKMRTIFELSRKQHLSYAEIAEELQITEHTVKSQVSNALRLLRLRLNISAGLLVFFLYQK